MSSGKGRLGRLLGRLGLGLLGVFLVMEVGLRLLGAGFLAWRARDARPGGQEGVVTVLSLGESSTALGGADSYPSQVEEILNGMDLGVRFRVVNQALPGIDSLILMQRLDEDLDRWKPDIVTAMMGINDGKKVFVDLGEEDPDPPPWLVALRKLKTWRLITFWSLTRDDDWNRVRTQRAFEAEAQRLREAIQAHPDDRLFKDLGALLRRQGRYQEALEVYTREMELYPGPEVLTEIGRLYRDQGLGDQELQAFREAVERWPDNHVPYRSLVRTLRNQGHHDQVLAVLVSQVAHLPDSLSWIDLASWHEETGRLEEAARAYQASIDATPNDYGYAGLGRVLSRLGRPAEAEVALLTSVALTGTGQACVELARFLKGQGRRDEARAAYADAIARGEDDWYFLQYASHTRVQDVSLAWLELARMDLEEGREEEARATLAHVQPNPMTAQSWATLQGKVQTRGLRLVAIQYPMRSVWPLELMVLPGPDVVLVDNQAPFEEAVARQGYGALFVDAYGGDFGHCTREGNHIVATQVARAIARTWYNAAEGSGAR